jgi:hypothetical protein
MLIETHRASAGRKDPGVRSDCYVELAMAPRGLSIDLSSKVAALYGDSVTGQGRPVDHGHQHAAVSIDDRGGAFRDRRAG